MNTPPDGSGPQRAASRARFHWTARPSPAGEPSRPTASASACCSRSARSALAALVLAAVLLTRHHDKNAAPTTVVVTTTPVTTSSTKATKPAKATKLILPVPDLVGQQWKDAATGLRRAGFHVSFVTVPSRAAPRLGHRAGSGGRGESREGFGHPLEGLERGAGPADHDPGRGDNLGHYHCDDHRGDNRGDHHPACTADDGSRAQPLRRASARRPATRPGRLPASIAYVPGTEPLGTVMAQSPAGGGSAKTGSQVTVNVSAGPNDTQDKNVPTSSGSGSHRPFRRCIESGCA